MIASILEKVDVPRAKKVLFKEWRHLTDCFLLTQLILWNIQGLYLNKDALAINNILLLLLSSSVPALLTYLYTKRSDQHSELFLLSIRSVWVTVTLFIQYIAPWTKMPELGTFTIHICASVLMIGWAGIATGLSNVKLLD
jgi:hypothetical protein